MSAIGQRSALSHSVLLGAVLVLLLWFSLPTYESIEGYWLDYRYSHGYLIVLISVLLIVRQIRRTPNARVHPSAVGLVWLIATSLAVAAAHAATTAIAAQVVLPAVWFSALWAAGGWAYARRLIAPIAYLYFAIPWWEALNSPLQRLTVVVVSAGIRLAEITAYIEGNYIHIPSGTFEVADGCSGLRYLVVGLALAVLAGLLHHQTWRPRLILIGLASVLALVANWLRVFIIVSVGYVTEMTHGLVQDHYYFGWLVFSIVCMAPLLFVSRAMQNHRHLSGAALTTGSSAPPRFYANAVLCWTLVVLGSGIWLGDRVHEMVFQSDSRSRQVQLPNSGGWIRSTEWPTASRPVFIGASTEDTARFIMDDNEIGVYLAHYAAQRPGQEVVFHGNHPEGHGSQVVATRPVKLEHVIGGSAPFVELEVMDNRGRTGLLWIQLRVSGHVTSQDWVAKIWQAVGVTKGRNDAQAVVLAAVCADDCIEARDRLNESAVHVTEVVYLSVDEQIARILVREGGA